MIDIHTHIIPGLDDGPGDMETSVAMGRLAVGEGTTAIISTSHSEEAAAVGYEGMQARLNEVRSAWAAAGLQIRLELGVEIFLQPGTVGDLKAHHTWTLAGSRYVLAELPYQPWPLYAEATLFELQVAGFTPILAHPERYTAIQSDPNRMYALTERGVLGQVTAGALLGEQGHNAKKSAETLLRHGLVQFLASDAHGTHRRLPLLNKAFQIAEEMLGVEAARKLVVDNPAHILDDSPLAPEPERVAPRKWSLGGLFGRD